MMIPVILKTLSITLSICAFLFAQSCASGIQVFVYNSNPEKGGMVRKQANELIEYSKTKGWKCLNEEDAKALFEDYTACKKLCK